MTISFKFHCSVFGVEALEYPSLHDDNPLSQMVSPWDIYAEQLSSLGYGHALWVPEPCQDAGEVHIGDVGYLRAGGFRPLFNSMRPAAHPANRRMGVPPGFEEFRPPAHLLVRRANEIVQTELHSASLRACAVSGSATAGVAGATASATLRYHCTESAGALLLLPQPAHLELLDCALGIKRYMAAHLARWLQFANDTLEIGLPERELLFVSGCVKTAHWAAAAFRSASRGAAGELAVSGGFLPAPASVPGPASLWGGAPSVSAAFSVSMSRCESPALFYRSGPTAAPAPAEAGDDAADSDPDSQDVEYDSDARRSRSTVAYDQCVFLQYYKMKSRIGILWRTIRAAAEPQDPRYDSSNGGESDLATGSTGFSDTAALGDGGVELELERGALGDGDGVEVGCPGSPVEVYDPVGCLLDYILEASSARLAFASTSDLMRLFTQIGGIPQDIMAALRALRPPVQVDEQGVGTIDSDALVASHEPVSPVDASQPIPASSKTTDGTSESEPESMCTPIAKTFPPEVNAHLTQTRVSPYTQIEAHAPNAEKTHAPMPLVTNIARYQPMGPPQETDMETESNDNSQVSHDLARQKLAVLAGRRHSDHGPEKAQPQPFRPQEWRQQMQQAGPSQSTSVANALISSSHPYDLPATAFETPMTPRTTRRQMLQTELSESLRRNLLWERQVGRADMTGRRGGVLSLPLTAMDEDGPAMAQQATQQPPQPQQRQQQQQNGDDKEERRRRAMARNRSLADGDRYLGW